MMARDTRTDLGTVLCRTLRKIRSKRLGELEGKVLSDRKLIWEVLQEIFPEIAAELQGDPTPGFIDKFRFRKYASENQHTNTRTTGSNRLSR